MESPWSWFGPRCVVGAGSFEKVSKRRESLSHPIGIGGKVLTSQAAHHSVKGSDDPENRGPQDRSRINVNEDYEVRYWTEELGVTEDRLRQLVKDHGVSVEAVRSAIGAK